MSNSTRGTYCVKIIATFADDSCKKVTIANTGHDNQRHADRWLARGAQYVLVTVWGNGTSHRLHIYLGVWGGDTGKQLHRFEFKPEPVTAAPSARATIAG